MKTLKEVKRQQTAEAAKYKKIALAFTEENFKPQKKILGVLLASSTASLKSGRIRLLSLRKRIKRSGRCLITFVWSTWSGIIDMKSGLTDRPGCSLPRFAMRPVNVTAIFCTA
jgi:hypothetical protein